MNVCFAPGSPSICGANTQLYYINGADNPSEEKIISTVIPIFKKICSDISVNFDFHLLYNKATPSKIDAAKQIQNGEAWKSAIAEAAVPMAFKISEYLNAYSNPVILIGHSQGAAVIEEILKNLESLPRYKSRIYVISMGGVCPVEGVHRVVNFKHEKDKIAYLACTLLYRIGNPNYCNISGSCDDSFCHDVTTYLRDINVQIAIQAVLSTIQNATKDK